MALQIAVSIRNLIELECPVDNRLERPAGEPLDYVFTATGRRFSSPVIVQRLYPLMVGSLGIISQHRYRSGSLSKSAVDVDDPLLGERRD
jgi:hypothetical protein